MKNIDAVTTVVFKMVVVVTFGLLLSADGATASCITVDTVVDNVVVKSSDGKVTLTGRALAGFDQITVHVFRPGENADEPVTVSVDTAQRWRVTLQLPLNRASRVVLERPGCADELEQLVTPVKSDPLTKRQRSAIQVIWLPDADAQIQDIATQTLDSVPNTATFVAAVKDEAIRVAADYLREYAITIGKAKADNQLRFTGEFVKGFYGLTLPRAGGQMDCGDAAQDDLIDIYIGTLAADIRARRTLWKLLAKDDKPEVRIADIGHILGTLAAHEALHAAGLVGCDWMQGDAEGHNNRRIEHLRKKRYGLGAHLMDPFLMVDPRSLIGRTNATDTTRGGLRHDPFSASYLSIIHPKE